MTKIVPLSTVFSIKISFFLLFSAVLLFSGCGGSTKPESVSDTDAGLTDEDYDTDEEETDADCDTDEEKTNADCDTDEEKTDTETDSKPDNDTDTSEIQDTDTAVFDPVFTRQPESMNIAPNDQSVTLVCEVEADGCDISYQWYESSDGTTDDGTPVAEATESSFETPVFTKKGIYYYYCIATIIPTSETGDVDTVALISDVASVAYTALPTLYINTPDSVPIQSKEEWIKNAGISLVGAEESWNFENVSTSIRGRGNSTWNKPKKPYALKLDKKQEIMGLPEHKRWVLLANYLDNTFIRNDTAFYLARIFEMDWTPDGDFVDLVLNGKYQGLYWLGEAIKVNKKRVNINDGDENMTDDEDKDYLIEMDINYDEPVKFKSPIHDLPYMIKNDDFMIDENNEITTGGQARLERLQAKITDLENLLYPDFTEGANINSCSAPDESYTEVIDIDSWAKFWFVNEIMDNTEVKHPKSCYFTFDSENNIMKAGPVWDFDWASLTKHSTPILKYSIYYNALFKSPAFKAKVKELWNEYSGNIDFETHIESMRSKLDTAAQYDTMLWGEHNDPSLIHRENFDAYVDFFKERVLDKLSVVDTDISKTE